MKIKPNLNVRLVLDVRRSPGDTSAATEVVHRFGHHFRQYEWPEDRPIQELFYFPSSLEAEADDRGAMHATTIVIDNARVFICSANITEAAHARNVEVGLVVRSSALAEQLTNYFNSMIADGSLKPVFDAAAAVEMSPGWHPPLAVTRNAKNVRRRASFIKASRLMH